MHVLVPFASDRSEACRHVLRDLSLPHLRRLLAALAPAARDDGSAHSLSPPHERALAAARGWQGGDGSLPFAAQAAHEDGLEFGDLPVGLLTPAHWQLGRDSVTLLDPEELALDEDESRQLFDSVRELVTSERFRFEHGRGSRWYLAREDLDGLPAASLDRVIGRNLDRWLATAGERSSAAQRVTGALLRRLQSEAQLVFHDHPVNEAREERGALTVNSFWMGGCARWQATAEAAEPVLATGLRGPALGGDWAAWAEAWAALDAGPLAALAARAATGQAVALTLCGERGAVRYETARRSWPARLRAAWQAAEPHEILGTL